MNDKINRPKIWQLTATTTPQEILSEMKNRKAVTIYNNGAVTVYLGSSGGFVATQGLPIPAGMERFYDSFNAQGQYFVIAESGTADLRIEETLQVEV
jgi:hypothetical protein